MRITIGIPSPDLVNPNFAFQNLNGIISYTKNHLKGLDSIGISSQAGVRTDRNRNIILHRVREQNNTDYILWLDADMLYPHDIICRYMEKEFDVMGCMYFKRSEPYDCVGYIKGSKPGKYTQLDPRIVPKDEVIEVDGLGFGGMMVNMKLYEKMGEDRWMKYSDNFHLPMETEEPKLTHDLMFCMKAQEYGAKILLHTGVRPGHLSEYVVTEKDWIRERTVVTPKVHVIMPTIHLDMAIKTMDILKTRAGVEFTHTIYPDGTKQGFVSLCNAEKKGGSADYYVYLTDDIFPSRNWLKDALKLMKEKDAGLVGFNDGKWKGTLATCGLVSAQWIKGIYGGNLFYEGYFGHYNDTELTLIAMQQGKYAYDPNISLLEVDYQKEEKKINKKDRALFNERKKTGFDGMVTDDNLLKAFS